MLILIHTTVYFTCMREWRWAPVTRLNSFRMIAPPATQGASLDGSLRFMTYYQPMLLLHSCLEFWGFAHGSYYTEGLETLYHQEEERATGHLRMIPRGFFPPAATWLLWVWFSGVLIRVNPWRLAEVKVPCCLRSPSEGASPPASWLSPCHKSILLIPSLAVLQTTADIQLE